MDLETLGKRLVACKNFRPMRGMRDLQGRTWDEALLWRWNALVDVPDLSDPATLGCVLHLYELTRVKRSRAEAVYMMIADWGLTHPHTRETLVAALEAAP